MTIVNGECLVVVQRWDNFVTLHAHEEARFEFVRDNVEKPDFYGSGNRRLESYVGIVDDETYKKVQTGVEVRRSQAPPNWRLKGRTVPERYRLNDFLPKEPIPGWQRERRQEKKHKHLFTIPFAYYYEMITNLFVILTLEEKVWLHVSVSKPDHEPTWYDLKKAKKLFIGDRFAVQFLPPEKYYLNFYKHCLHLWCRVDDKPIVPDALWKNPNFVEPEVTP